MTAAPNSDPELYVAIATAGRPARCRKTLQSLTEARKPPSFRGVVLIENGARLGAEALAAEFPALAIRYGYSPEPNKSAALNLALQLIPAGSLIVFLDDDILVNSGMLEAYAGAARELGPKLFFGGKCVADYGNFTPPRFLLQAMPFSVIGLDYKEGHGHTGPAIFFLGFNWAAFRDDLLAAGGFDPRFGPGSRTFATGQETEMQTQLKRIGLRGVYIPEAVATHSVGRDTFTWKWFFLRGVRNGCEHGLRDEKRSRAAVLRLPLRALKFIPLALWAWLRGDQEALVNRVYFFAVNLGEVRAALWRFRQPAAAA